MNEFTAHGMMIGLCSLVMLGLLSSHISVVWGRAKEVCRKSWDEWIRATGW